MSREASHDVVLSGATGADVHSIPRAWGVLCPHVSRPGCGPAELVADSASRLWNGNSGVVLLRLLALSAQ
jgi:hypothetical protein